MGLSMIWWLLGILLVVAFIAAAKLGLLKKGRGGRTEHWPVFPKKVLTPVEQQLYHRLIRAYPDHVVLAQVSFSQIIGVKKGHDFRAIWNRYNRLTADFVLCNKDFSITAVIELDDRSHDHPTRQDADRRKAAICEAAGIPLHRLNVNPLPNESELHNLVPMHAAGNVSTGTAAPVKRVVPFRK